MQISIQHLIPLALWSCIFMSMRVAYTVVLVPRVSHYLVADGMCGYGFPTYMHRPTIIAFLTGLCRPQHVLCFLLLYYFPTTASPVLVPHASLCCNCRLHFLGRRCFFFPFFAFSNRVEHIFLCTLLSTPVGLGPFRLCMFVAYIIIALRFMHLLQRVKPKSSWSTICVDEQCRFCSPSFQQTIYAVCCVTLWMCT